MHLCHQWALFWLVVIRGGFLRDTSGSVEQECATLNVSILTELMTQRKSNRQYNKGHYICPALVGYEWHLIRRETMEDI